MKRSAVKRSQKPIPKKRSKPRRTLQFRDKKYREWVAQRGQCQVCEILKQRGDRFVFFGRDCCLAHGPAAGKSLKGPDNEGMALCWGSRWTHHEEQHRFAWPAFETKYGFSRAEKAAELYAEYLAWKGRK